jgi:serine-type D-Ala-D-Ala carboxypeptidase (penicillin-binding protein 5/6)
VRVVGILVALLLVGLAIVPGAPAVSAVADQTAAAGCAGQQAPPPPAAREETSTPSPLPWPAEPVGGPALGGCGEVGPRAPATVTAASYVLADLDTGAVLAACGAHEYGTPASVQKLLLTATFLPKLDPRQVVTVTQADLDFEAGSSAVGLLLGGRYSIETLWLGLLLESGNDAANVLARLGGGSAAGGVQAMNEQARRLGAYQTHAVTPSGLDGPGQFTSAYDLALIARADFADEAFRRYTLTQRTQIPKQPQAKPPDPRGFQIQNENQLIFKYAGALGGKTGFTSLARHTYVGAASRNGHRLVVALLGAEAQPLRGWQQGAALLDWGFSLPADARVGRLVDPGEPAPAESPTAAAAAGSVAAAQQPAAGTTTPRVAGLAAAAVVVILGLLLVLILRRRRG